MLHLINTLSVATLTFLAVDIASAHLIEKRDLRPTPASLYARQATTGAFSDFSGTLSPSISSIISSITSGTPTITAYTVAQTYTAGAVNPSISNAPPLPNREFAIASTFAGLLSETVRSLTEPSLCFSAASSVLVANFPPLDMIPNPSFGMGAKILASVDLSDIPDIPTTDGTCAGSPSSAANAQKNHWVRIVSREPPRRVC